MERNEMNRREVLQGMGAAMMMLSAGGAEAQSEDDAGGGPVYELRIYHTYPGKLEPLLKRFREGETAIFARCGMHGVGYWTPDDDPLKGNALIYMLRHKSRAAATESWAKFSKDPEWVKLKAESEANGAFVEKHDITFMTLTDFSPKV
jgi:NIPSNAP